MPTIEIDPADVRQFASHMRYHHDLDLPHDVLDRAARLFIERVVKDLVTDPDWTRRHFWYRWDDALTAAEQRTPEGGAL